MRRATLVIFALMSAVVYIALPPGSAHAAFPGTNGQISYARFNRALGHAQVWVANPDGSHAVPLTSAPSRLSDWSSDGSRIAYDFFDGQTLQIATINADGTGMVQLTSDENTFHGEPAWSLDDTKIAIESDAGNFPTGEGIYLLDSSTGNVISRVTANPYGAFDANPRWSPDGQWIVFTRAKQALRTTAITALFLVRSDGSNLHHLTSWGLNADSADWSPGRTEISFYSHSALPAQSGIYTIHPDGTGLTQVLGSARSGFAEAKWSPDGTKLLLTGGTQVLGGGPPDMLVGLWTVNPDGSNLTQIVPNVNFAFPAWGTHALSQ
jgi:Tol biopolymer transport system component